MEQSVQKTYKRRVGSVLIHKPMQREFTFVVISLLIISSLTIGFVIHATIREAMMGGGYRFGKISPYEVMSDVSYNLIVRVSLVLFITIFAIAIFGIFFLHRIAGPVYRFRHILRKLSNGEIPSEVRLREGDYFTETAADLNNVLRLLQERRKQIEELQGKIGEAMRQPPSSSTNRLLEEVKSSLTKLL